MTGEDRAISAIARSGIAYEVIRNGRVGSLAEAATVRGMELGQVLKTLVVRRAREDFLFVLVPGDREISWPKLRLHLGVNRLSMPDAATARDVTGYERGTITPFGATRRLPVLADATITRRTVSIGAGEHGVAVVVGADALVVVLAAEVADITEPA